MISAVAREVMVRSGPPVVGLEPKLRVSPPMPVTNTALTTRRFLLEPRSTRFSICRPDTAMKPYSATQAPPMTHFGMELISATNGVKNERIIQPSPAVMIVTMDAFPVIATQPMDSP